jgi:hypothetical protein
MGTEPFSTLRDAVQRSYGWKSPVQRTKNKEFSFALQFIALAFFLLRLIWVLQLAKVCIRCSRGPDRDIPPWLDELYFMGSVAAEACICLAVANGFTPFRLSTNLIGGLCIWKITETLTYNLYYLMLRPVLEKNPPHSTYMSFVLAAFGLVEVWLVLSLAWYYLGTTTPRIDSILTAIYFTSVTFFTIGYGDYVPTGNFSHVLAIISIFFSIGMIGIVLGRAISLLKPLPEPDENMTEDLKK